MGGGGGSGGALVASFLAAALLLVLAACACSSKRRESFWVPWPWPGEGAGGGGEFVRPVSAEGLGQIGVPNMAWGEAYWPPAYCAADLQEAAAAAPSREGWDPSPRPPPLAPPLTPHGPLWEEGAAQAAKHYRSQQPSWRFAPCPGQPDLRCRAVPAWWW